MKLFGFALAILIASAPVGGTEATSAAASSDYASLGAVIARQLGTGRLSAVERRFSAQLVKVLSPRALASQSQEWRATSGDFVVVRSSSVLEQAGEYHVVVVTCSFKRAANDNVLVTFDRGGKVVGLYFGPKPTDAAKDWTAPEYASVRRFREIAVTVNSGPWYLPGMLTLPAGDGPFPAVVLIPGSPPLDEDATVGPNKMFKDLAWGLANRGIAVLRYTKRTHQFGAGLGNGPLSSFSLRDEVSDDAGAAVGLLARRREVDHLRIYLLGHSLGGFAAPAVAAANSRVAGIIAMGAPATQLLTTFRQQVETRAMAGGDEGADAARVVPTLEKLKDGGFAAGDVVSLFGNRSPVSYWLSVRDYEPATAAAQLAIPVLILSAGHDASAPDAFDDWKRALAGHDNATLKFYPQLFHLFMPSAATAMGKDAPEDWGRPSHVSAEVVDDVQAWISSR